MDMIENQTFDEIKVGDRASLVRTLSKKDIELFAVMSGDVNPAHVDEEYARSEMFHTIIAHLDLTRHQTARPRHDLSGTDAALSSTGDGG